MPPADTKSRLVFEGFVLDRELRVLRCGNETVDLRPQSFDVLDALATHAGQLVTRDELRSTVWNGRVVTDDSLTHCIVDVRRALGDNAQRLVRTVRGRGYVFETDVSFEPVDSTIRERERAVDDRRRNSSGRVLLAALTSCAIAGAWWLASRQKAGAPPDASSLHGGPTVAVLPFDNITADESNAFISDGLAEEILHALAESPGLHVVAKTSSFSLRDMALPIVKIGQMLNATHVLEGSVRIDVDRLRVTAQLIDAANGMHVWSRAYDRKVGDVLEIQAQIATDVAATVRGTLEQDPVESVGQDLSPAAFGIYLESRFLYGRRMPGDLAAAERGFEAVLAENPSHVGALNGLAGIYRIWLHETRHTEPDDVIVDPDLLARRRAVIEKALSVEPDNAEALAKLSQQYRFEGDPVSARHFKERAAALAPDNPFSADAWALLWAGQDDQAVALQRRVLAHDPLSAALRENLVAVLLAAGRQDQAEAELKKIEQLTGTELSLDNGYVPAALPRIELAIVRSEFDWALAQARQWPEPVERVRLLGIIHARMQDRDALEEAQKSLGARAGFQARCAEAEIAAVLGRTDQALDILATARHRVSDDGAERRHRLTIARHCIDSPFFATLRRDPDVAAYLGILRQLVYYSEAEAAELFSELQ